MANHDGLADSAHRQMFVETRESCMINSGPGCGKTHECIRKIAQCVDRKFVILVYNKSIRDAIHAQLTAFPNGEVYTLHAMARKLLYPANATVLTKGEDAFKKMKKRIKERCLARLSAPEHLGNLMAVGKTLGCTRRGVVDKNKTLTRCFNDVFKMTRWEFGASEQARRCCDVVEHEIFDAVQHDGFYDYDWAVLTCIRKGLCERMADDYDCLIFDEAQDLSKELYQMKPVTKSMQIIYMGDTNQSIYGYDENFFNAFDRDEVSGLRRFEFTHSFRCSPDIVEFVKEQCDELDVKMTGDPSLRTRIYRKIDEFLQDGERPAVTELHYLAWSHKSICHAVLEAYRQGHEYSFIGKSKDEYLTMLKEKVKDQKINTHLLDQVESALELYNKSAKLVFSTVHQAKGLTLKNIATDPQIHTSGAPHQLRFVALTRATDTIFASIPAAQVFTDVMVPQGEPPAKRRRQDSATRDIRTFFAGPGTQ